MACLLSNLLVATEKDIKNQEIFKNIIIKYPIERHFE
jgi:hypothetical protein